MSSFVLAVVLVGVLLAAYTDRPIFWLLIGPAPLAALYTVRTFLRQGLKRAAGYPTALVAANGSGKTSTILAPAGLWALFNWPFARVIVTSASWSQLKKQFFDNIPLFRFDPYFRKWTFNEAEIRTPEGGFIVGVSLDEAGRAEGYHDWPDSSVMIMADEAGSIATVYSRVWRDVRRRSEASYAGFLTDGRETFCVLSFAGKQRNGECSPATRSKDHRFPEGTAW